MAEPQTYYDLFLIEFLKLREKIEASPYLPRDSDAFRMLTSGTPSRIMTACGYFDRVFEQARRGGDEPSKVLRQILALYGAPDVPEEEARELVSSLESLSRIISECKT